MIQIFWLLTIILFFSVSDSVMVRITDSKPKWVVAAEKDMQSMYRNGNDPSINISEKSEDPKTELLDPSETTLDDMLVNRRREPAEFSGRNIVD